MFVLTFRLFFSLGSADMPAFARIGGLILVNSTNIRPQMPHFSKILRKLGPSSAAVSYFGLILLKMELIWV